MYHTIPHAESASLILGKKFNIDEKGLCPAVQYHASDQHRPQIFCESANKETEGNIGFISGRQGHTAKY